MRFSIGLPMTKPLTNVRKPNGWFCQTSSYEVTWQLEQVGSGAQKTPAATSAATTTVAKWTQLADLSDYEVDIGRTYQSLVAYHSLVYVSTAFFCKRTAAGADRVRDCRCTPTCKPILGRRLASPATRAYSAHSNPNP